MNVGFIGIGHMGLPMAGNLLRAGIDLVVWNRTPERCDALVAQGARRACSVDDLFARSRVVLTMLRDAAALDAVLGRRTPRFAARMSGRVVVQLGTIAPTHSLELESDILAAGGCYVEAPVSGSRAPAEQGQLVGMVAGAPTAVEFVLPLLDPLCTRVFHCGPVPGAMRMKLAANHFLIGMVAVLAETAHAAVRGGLNLALLEQVLDVGPMASAVSRAKMGKLVRADDSPQAAIRDVATIAELVRDECARVHAHAPLIGQSAALYRAACASGCGDADMVAVVHAFDAGVHALP
ncbi:MAG: NAD(P)-dependent oxidoreductase [Proteobacteria bacterium]|nr:NAD(P)-dependent oxidoreductase [Pseudomonadota bacterium]